MHLKIHNIPSGFFSNFNMVMTALWTFLRDAQNKEPLEADIDWSDTNEWFHYGPPNVNVWNTLFEPSLNGLQGMLKVQGVSSSSSSSRRTTYDAIIREYLLDGIFITTRNARYAYREHEWRHKLHRIYKAVIRPLPDIVLEADRFWADCVGTTTHTRNTPLIIGMHVRAPVIAMEQGNEGWYPSLQDFANAALTELQIHQVNGKFAKIMLATDTQEAYSFMKEQFGDLLVFRDHSLYSNKEDHHVLGIDTVHARDVWIDAMLLARSHVFIHAVSNVATAVLYMNPYIKSVFLEAPVHVPPIKKKVL